MRKFIETLMLVLLLTAYFTINANAEFVTDINDLIEKAKEYDGQEVTIQGEAIGESMKRGDYTWVNVNDGTNAIGIWLESDMVEKIEFYGDYKHTGDTIQVTGTFYRACTEHGGEADVHGSSLEIVKVGNDVKEEISSVKIITAVLLALFAAFCMLVLNKRIQSRRI